MAQLTYIGNTKKPASITLPAEIPTIDFEQIRAGMHMHKNMRMLLLSDPGAGKTLTALDALLRAEIEREDSGDPPAKVIVICPLIAIRTWAQWISKVYQEADIDCVVQILRGNKDKIREDATHLIVTYGSLSRKGALLTDALVIWGADVLICDESHFLNGGSSNRTEAVLGRGMIADQVEWAWFLTGTPVPRYLDGLWPVLHRCFPERLASFGIASERGYLETFCVIRSVKYGQMRYPKKTVVGSRNMKLMNRILYDGPNAIAIRNKLKMRQEPVFSDLTLDLKPSVVLLDLQKQALKAQVEMEVDDYGNPVKVVDPTVAKALHVYGQELAPLVSVAVTSELQQVDDGILVLFWHTAVGLQLFNDIEGARLIYGGTPQKARDAAVDDFNSGKARILLGQISAMGVALNLQEKCHTVIFAEDTYSDAANQQAWQRVWRRGQTKTVNVKFCKTLQPLADLRPKVSKRKREQAREAID